jgi:hypothetical protein
MRFEDDIESLLGENKPAQIAVDRIRSYFNCLHSPFKSKDMIHIVNLLNMMSKKYTTSNIQKELYILFISYYILPTSYSTCSIGEIYMNGIRNKKKSNLIKNIRRNNSKAIEYLTLSSTFENSKANYLLGIIYLRKKQYIKSMYYLELSASKCNSDALYQLGIIYFYGNNYYINKNFHLAYKYFSHSALHNHELAIFILKNFGESIKFQYINQRINEMIINGIEYHNERDCSICFESDMNGYILSCSRSHFICKTCITTLLENEILYRGKIKCPLCRKIQE